MRRLSRTVSMCCLQLMLLMSLTPKAAAQENIQTALIGLAMPLATPRGQTLRDAVQQGIDDANKRNLVINGKRTVFKLFAVDDKNDNNLAALSARAMVNAGVIGVVGHLSTDASLIGAKIYNEAGIPQISPTTTARVFTQQGYRNVFQLLGHTDITGDYLAYSALNQIKAKRIMVIDNETGLGDALANSFIKRLRSKGADIVARASISQKTSDFNAVLDEARKQRADMIFLAAIVPQSMAFAQRMQQQNMAAALMLAGGAVNYNFPHSADEYDANTWILVHGQPEEKLPGFKSLEKNYAAKFSTNLIPQSLFAYDCVGVLVEATKQADSLAPDKLVAALHKVRYAGVSGSVSFDAEGSLNDPAYSLYQVHQKHWQMVRTFP
ncbi:branched-chain amino acid ABC transporter substrate-binding protein [Herbaspirillum sp. RV1423]|uniref:branched-chain amino acid ABC transporter substrate-binding protein n=1 Tax=Herbaspirillum sp. RV1423 TaxID=1443993 RepID=UPI0009DF7E93|nr:branched-chain amino acid ABC transporter substrate-binding protein [Herbaspirillum sp. RV1423]